MFKNESRKTGGGSPPKKSNQAAEKIISFEEDPSFSGLQGFDSGKTSAYFNI